MCKQGNEIVYTHLTRSSLRAASIRSIPGDRLPRSNNARVARGLSAVLVEVKKVVMRRYLPCVLLLSVRSQERTERDRGVADV